jgi:hypothetical protein
MGIGLIAQLTIWAVYLIIAGGLFRYVARHAVALYCTRAKNEGTLVRVFLQNLEDESLSGKSFKLSIELQPHTAISKPCVRAGSKTFWYDESKLRRGIFEVHFENLPPLDTWLFEIDTQHDTCKVSVKLDKSDRLIEHGRIGKKNPDSVGERDFSSSSGLATLVLDHHREWTVSGSYVTPRWSVAFWLMILAISGYLLIVLALLPDSCAAGTDALACAWQRARNYMGLGDLGACLVLVLATWVSMIAGRRQPFPIAQGYLERTELRPFPPDDLSTAADVIPQSLPAPTTHSAKDEDSARSTEAAEAVKDAVTDDD